MELAKFLAGGVGALTEQVTRRSFFGAKEASAAIAITVFHNGIRLSLRDTSC